MASNNNTVLEIESIDMLTGLDVHVYRTVEDEGQENETARWSIVLRSDDTVYARARTSRVRADGKVVLIENGTILRNGAVVVAWKVPSASGYPIVLALLESGEYATWVVNEDMEAHWGDYFAPDRFLAAVDAFRGRD